MQTVPVCRVRTREFGSRDRQCSAVGMRVAILPAQTGDDPSRPLLHTSPNNGSAQGVCAERGESPISHHAHVTIATLWVYVKSHCARLAQEEVGTAYSVTMKGCSTSYYFWIINDTEPEDASTVSTLMARQLHFQQELLNKTLEMRRNLMGDDFERYARDTCVGVLVG